MKLRITYHVVWKYCGFECDASNWPQFRVIEIYEIFIYAVSPMFDSSLILSFEFVYLVIIFVLKYLKFLCLAQEKWETYVWTESLAVNISVMYISIMNGKWDFFQPFWYWCLLKDCNKFHLRLVTRSSLARSHNSNYSLLYIHFFGETSFFGTYDITCFVSDCGEQKKRECLPGIIS